MMTVGVCVNHWVGRPIDEEFRKLYEHDYHYCQLLSWNPDLWTPEERDAILAAAEKYAITITGFWCGWQGPCVWNFYEGQKTLGLVPPEYREMRIKNLCDGADFAKSLGLTDTLWSLIVPGALSVYNAIICKTAIQALPDSLSESAYIDGASDIRIMFQIVTPLIKPTLAVLTLYYTVGKWNNWFSASIYIRKEELMPIQNVLRGILLSNSQDDGLRGDQYDKFAETIKYAAIVISSIPIMCIYPFLQKYFTKGVMIGAVKG